MLKAPGDQFTLTRRLHHLASRQQEISPYRTDRRRMSTLKVIQVYLSVPGLRQYQNQLRSIIFRAAHMGAHGSHRLRILYIIDQLQLGLVGKEDRCLLAFETFPLLTVYDTHLTNSRMVLVVTEFIYQSCFVVFQ